MRSPTVEDAMKLLAEVSGWSDQCLAVTVRYMRRREYLSQDESTLRDDDWWFVVSTKVCGPDLEVTAQGRTLEAALISLAHQMPSALMDKFSHWKKKAEEMEKLLDT